MKRVKILVGLATIICFASCHCHHGEDDPISTELKYPVKVHLDVDKWLYLYEKEETRSDDSLVMRYTAWAVSPLSDKPIATVSTTEPEIDMRLPMGRCRIITFADYVHKDRLSKDLYFFTDEYKELLIMDKYGYKGNDEKRQGYWTVADVDVTSEHNCPLYLTLKPAMAKVRIVATDTAKFDVGAVRLSYPEVVPAAINGYTGHINYSWADVSFDAVPTKKDLTTDYIYAPVEQDSIALRVEIYDKEKNLRARKRYLKVPFIRRGITTVTGPFYSTLEVDSVPGKPSGGGVGIDPEFDATIVVPV